MKNLITAADILSNKPQLRNNQIYLRFKTIFGGALTIIMTILIIAASISFGIDLLERKNSTITYNLLPATDKSKAQIGQFPYMVALLDNGLKLLPEDDRWYGFLSESWDFYPKTVNGSTEMLLKRTIIETERCDLDKHFGEWRDLFKDVPYLEHHYCLVPGQNITVYGLYGSTKPNNFIDHWISTCVNNTELNKTNCYSREESKARLVNTYLSYVFLDTTIDHNDIQNPVKYILRSEILPVSSSIYKRIFFYLRNISYKTDYGFIFQDIREEKIFQVSDSKENVDLRPEGTVPGSFALISVLMDKYNNFYFRKYYKGQNFLADMGGIIKGLLIIGTFINFLISEEFYFIDLIESMYGVNIISESERKKRKLYKEEFMKSFNSDQNLVISNLNNLDLKKKNEEEQPG